MGDNMSYIEESLSTGEKVEGMFKPHWFAWVPTYIWLLLGLVILGLTWLIKSAWGPKYVGLIFGLAGWGVTWFIALYQFLRLRSIEQGVTNKRVILKKGIISRRTDEMKLTSIETVEINQGVWGRIFGFGTVKVTGRGISDVVYTRIDDPMSVKRQIESISNPAV
ncbi:MAG: PH domain-containing protein [Oxalobacter sp.]|nr:MAG: PH domain-containing protein [Oxalobacter sp.]